MPNILGNGVLTNVVNENRMPPKTNAEVIADSLKLAKSRLTEDEQRELDEIGKRSADIVNTIYAFHDWEELRHKVIAIRLEDGGSDCVLYDNRRDAVRHQKTHGGEWARAYLVLAGVGPGGTSARQMSIYLKFCRDVHKAGYRFPDPDDVNGGLQVAMTTAWKDKYTQLVQPWMREPTPEELAPIIEILRKTMGL
jgi:hypothetical protein